MMLLLCMNHPTSYRLATIYGHHIGCCSQLSKVVIGLGAIATAIDRARVLSEGSQRKKSSHKFVLDLRWASTKAILLAIKLLKFT